MQERPTPHSFVPFFWVFINKEFEKYPPKHPNLPFSPLVLLFSDSKNGSINHGWGETSSGRSLLHFKANLSNLETVRLSYLSRLDDFSFLKIKGA